MTLLNKLYGFMKSAEAMAILAVVGFGLTIYQTWFNEKHPAIVYEIVSNSKVLDVYTPVSKLDILYDGESLKNSNLELHLVVLEIKNTGATDITKKDFDEAEPFGLMVTRGRLLDAPSMSASSVYLERNVKISRTNPNHVQISPFLFDAGEWIKLQLLIAAPTGAAVDISPIGKISGISKIDLFVDMDQKSEEGFWDQVTKSNSIWVDLARMPVYAFGFVILLYCLIGVSFAMGFAISYFPELRNENKRKKTVKEYSFSRNLTIADQVVLEGFKNTGESAIYRFKFFAKRVSERNKIVSVIKDNVDEESLQKIIRLYDVETPEFISINSADNALVSEQGHVIHINDNLFRAVADFEAYLCAKGELKENVVVNTKKE